jgi:2-oxoglutarate ferredoxin oxidoreductase subunit alpha
MGAEELEKIESFHRYLDVDADGIPYRTFPGVHPKGSYFTRGSGHNMYGAYTEDRREYQQVVDRLRLKWETAKDLVPVPVVDYSEKYRVGIISFGSCDGAVREARDRLMASGVGLNYLRVKAFPFNKDVQDFLDAHDRIYVVEQNRDAQLRSLLLLETQVHAEKLVATLTYDGLPIHAWDIVNAVNEDMAAGAAA